MKQERIVDGNISKLLMKGLIKVLYIVQVGFPGPKILSELGALGQQI